jgi:hypothetical protein
MMTWERVSLREPASKKMSIVTCAIREECVEFEEEGCVEYGCFQSKEIVSPYLLLNPQIDQKRGQSSPVVPLSPLPKEKGKEKSRNRKMDMGGGHANSLYNSRPPNKSRYTSNRRYAIRIQGRKKQKPKKKEKDKSRTGMIIISS